MQCPAYTYRQGLYNAEINPVTGSYVYRSYKKVTDRADDQTKYRTRNYDRSTVTISDNDWDSQPLVKSENGNNYYPVLIPF